MISRKKTTRFLFFSIFCAFYVLLSSGFARGETFVLSCTEGDTLEKDCCCFFGQHTYIFAPTYVRFAEIRFDTGRGFGCKSNVFIETLNDDLWTIRHTLEATSSGTAEKHIIQADLPLNRTIEGIRIRDNCVCCIDFSEITLHTEGAAPQEKLPDLPYPTLWEINGNGEVGTLHFRENNVKNQLHGSLLGATMSGEMTNRHLVLHCTRKGLKERWDGWILSRSEAPENAVFFMAGTFSKEGYPGLFPWYAVPRGTGPFSYPDTPFGSPSKNPQALMGTIYALPQGTSRLPNFSKLSPVGTIYTDSLNIPTRKFTQGFPGITNRFEWFGLVYEGRFLLDKGGNYTFRLHSDDGSRLWIDSKVLIDNDGIHPPQSESGNIFLSPGEHTLWLEYFQGPRETIALSLYALYPGETEERIFSPRWLPLF